MSKKRYCNPSGNAPESPSLGDCYMVLFLSCALAASLSLNVAQIIASRMRNEEFEDTDAYPAETEEE